MIAAIEQAILARLRDTGQALGIRWRTLATYPVDWEEYLNATSEVTCPAAWVVFAGWNEVERVTDGEIHVTGSFGLMVADRNDRPSEQAQRHGGPDQDAEPGSYHLLLAAVSVLAGQTLGLDLVSSIEPGPVRAVAATAASRKQRMSRYACELTVRFPIVTIEGDVDAPAPGDLQLLHANWDVPALGSPDPVDRDRVTPGAQLPDDDHADSTDIVSMEDQS